MNESRTTCYLVATVVRVSVQDLKGFNGDESLVTSVNRMAVRRSMVGIWIARADKYHPAST